MPRCWAGAAKPPTHRLDQSLLSEAMQDRVDLCLCHFSGCQKRTRSIRRFEPKFVLRLNPAPLRIVVFFVINVVVVLVVVKFVIEQVVRVVCMQDVMEVAFTAGPIECIHHGLGSRRAVMGPRDKSGFPFTAEFEFVFTLRSVDIAEQLDCRRTIAMRSQSQVQGIADRAFDQLSQLFRRYLKPSSPIVGHI